MASKRQRVIPKRLEECDTWLTDKTPRGSKPKHSASKGTLASSSSKAGSQAAVVEETRIETQQKGVASRGSAKGRTLCVMCSGTGLLLWCSAPDCTTCCHLHCARPPLTEVPEGDWFCAVRTTKMTRSFVCSFVHRLIGSSNLSFVD
eukprot:7113624-Pyramimonas_sp.AAC.1